MAEAAPDAGAAGAGDDGDGLGKADNQCRFETHVFHEFFMAAEAVGNIHDDAEDDGDARGIQLRRIGVINLQKNDLHLEEQVAGEITRAVAQFSPDRELVWGVH